MHERLTRIEAALKAVKPSIETLQRPQESLRDEVHQRLRQAEESTLFSDGQEQADFIQGSLNTLSRSDWYAYSEHFLTQRDREPLFAQLRAELIDPAYNSIFAETNEGFLQDNIRYLNAVPAQILDASMSIKSLRKEIQLVQYPIKIFEIISSLGSTELLKLITDEAVSYLEDHMTERGYSWMSRKNWFGMYPRMRKFMGLEIK